METLTHERKDFPYEQPGGKRIGDDRPARPIPAIYAEPAGHTQSKASRTADFKTEQQYGFTPPLNVRPCGTYTAVDGQECPPALIVHAMFVSLSKVMANFSPCKLSSCNDGETPANIRVIQKLAGLPATGVLDRSTWAYLVQLYQALVTRG